MNIEEQAAYEQKLKEWNEYMESIKPQEPNRDDYVGPYSYEESMREYNKALAEWQMKRSCDAPNPPGYTKSNND